MKIKTSELRQIRPEEFDATLLEKWCAEGRLYVRSEAEAEDASAWKRGALEYVAAAEKYCTERWKPYVRQLWVALTEDDLLAAGMVMRNKRVVNRYFLTCLVYNLQVRGVYQPVERVSQLQLHLCMERTPEKNSIYRNWGRYALTDAQRKRMAGILCDFASQNRP